MKNFIIGLLLGGIIVYLLLDKPSKPVEEVAADAEIEREHPPDAIKEEPLRVVGSIDKTVKQEKLNIYSKLKLQKGDVVAKKKHINKPKKNLKLNLNSFSVGLLENSWDELPDHASSERLDEGWKISLKRKDSFFSRFGFKDGDVINYDSLRSDGLSEGQEELMERVVAILRHIEE